MKSSNKAAADIMSIRLIICNEAPMLSAFGGKIIIFGGDFRQILSVVRYASRQTRIQNCCIKWIPDLLVRIRT